ncbi:DUF5819 family protein [Streptomyces sp. H27-D2]|uniref:DUF5819 family protein n=1 Tax=Streptomyces sp. H27-D2 TaxID=3046304 RepID=UPI002DBF7BEF|nr:DUF5819 family protein [Streptomyces sp. H27-D2]MEC4017385.1 DUF5819 family protein [Streptomyces sp. H27-D2]
MEPNDGKAGGIAALSLPSRIVVAVAVAVVAVAAAVHLAMIFLHVAPSNTVTKQHGGAVDAYVYPEFEQNWKLFAPNPLQQNIAVQARAEVVGADGATGTTDWTDLSARDGATIRHSLLPSHTAQNELRRAWDFYAGSHEGENGTGSGDENARSTRTRENAAPSLRGRLSERYIRRIVVLRLGPEWSRQGSVQRVQVRSETAPVGPPPWSDEKIDPKAVHRVMPWWQITADDRPKGTSR